LMIGIDDYQVERDLPARRLTRNRGTKKDCIINTIAALT